MPDGLPGLAPSRLPSAAQVLGALAYAALARELALTPKPGLVTPLDAGSHRDMDATTFRRSLTALRDYFPQIATAGLERASFARLRELGLAAEARMLSSTGGINTHRGAIFNLGLLCASAGRRLADGQPLSAGDVCAGVARHWGADLEAAARLASHAAPGQVESSQGKPSHGSLVAARHGAGGARAEALAGFPAVRQHALPAYRRVLAAGAEPASAALEALFSLIAVVEDTNLLWRAGPAGLDFAQRQARTFLASGGVLAAGWRLRAQGVCAAFVARNLSPGGSADLLAVTLFLHALCASGSLTGMAALRDVG